MNFDFTDYVSIPPNRSSAVAGIYCNFNTNDLAVSLSSGMTYAYSDVGVDDYNHFITADSLGKTFAHIKKNYGPGQIVTSTTKVPFDEGSATVGTPKALTYSDKYFDLSSPEKNAEKAPVSAKATVFFVSGGVDRSYTMDNAESLSEVLNDMNDIFDALGVDAEVFRVVFDL